MTYRVEIAQRAKNDLAHYLALSARHAPTTAELWLARFETALQSLADVPQRWPLAPEDNLTSETIRQMFFGKRNGRYRVLFTIREETVIVLHIRRGSMDQAGTHDIADE